MSAKALKELKVVTDRSHKHVVYIQPEMVPKWQDSYDRELLDATQAALNAGADPEKVFRLIDSIASVDLDELPPKYLAACVEGGLTPDTDIYGETLLHVLLNHPYPPPIKLPLDNNIEVPPTAAPLLQQQWSGRNPACGSVTLNELLSRKATPNREDTAGNTAMHMLVACMVQRVHYPDPKLPEKENGADEDVIQEGSMAAGADVATVEAQRRSAEQTAAAAAQGNVPQNLEDNDAARAAYAEVGFKMLLAAGWSPGWRNHNSYTVANLIEAGLAKYQSELYDLQDPEGVAQTTVALLVDKAPEKDLQDFLQHKIAGVQAVVNCLQVMHGLAATAEMPRKARSALSLVALWLVLLAAAMYWMFSRQQ